MERVSVYTGLGSALYCAYIMFLAESAFLLHSGIWALLLVVFAYSSYRAIIIDSEQDSTKVFLRRSFAICAIFLFSLQSIAFASFCYQLMLVDSIEDVLDEIRAIESAEV